MFVPLELALASTGWVVSHKRTCIHNIQEGEFPEMFLAKKIAKFCSVVKWWQFHNDYWSI